MLKGNQARIAAYVDSAYFLLYNRTLQGISEASGTVSAEIAERGARIDGSLAHAALTRASQVELLSQPLYNPTGGYASYVVPAAFILILQQTLFLGAATVGGVAFEQGGSAGRRRRAASRAILGQALAHLFLAMPGIALYLIILPRIYGFSTLGQLARPSPDGDTVRSVGELSRPVRKRLVQAARDGGGPVHRRQSAPVFHRSACRGRSRRFPTRSATASRIFPSTSAIDGLVRINQMGASLNDVWRDWLNLWILTAIYGLLAVAAARFFTNNEAAHGA